MPRSRVLALAAAVSCVSACGGGPGSRRSVPGGGTGTEDPMPPATDGPITYPTARKGDVVDDYHGTRVPDPYRWLEDPDSAETRAWVEAENKITFGFLGKIPQRAAIAARITALWNYERVSAPGRRKTRVFWSKNDGLQNQAVVYWAEGLDAAPKVLLDPNAMSQDGTVALAGTNVTEDARRVAYGVQRAGSDWSEWHVRDVDTGEDLPDVVKWVKFSDANWTNDGAGFFYGRYPEPKPGEEKTGEALNMKVYYHEVGTGQDQDVLVYERPDEPKWAFELIVSEDGRYLVNQVWKGTGEERLVYYMDLARWKPGQKVVMRPLIQKFEHKFNFVGNDGPVLWFHTDARAPRGRVVAIDTRHPDPERWVELIPQTEDALVGVSTVGGRLFANYLHDAHSRVVMHDEKGKRLGEVTLPGIGTASGFGGRRYHKDTFYSFTSQTVPTTIFRYDLATGKSEVHRAPKVDFDASNYETKQVFVTSKDGTRVPMFITHKKGLALDGNNPTLLYGYGGFNVSLTPSFDVSEAVWMEMGGVMAIANLRGGGEYGEEWHKAGIKDRKQNVFDDFIASAEWLIANKYTRSSRLAIEGGSNGGLLVGACMTQRPDLFGAALPAVGVMDMLRFHKFTIGWAWVDDYGSSDDAADFKALLAYSPLQNIKPGTAYPPTMITTADHDDRVVPAHSFKFAAALQAAHTGPNPVLIRIQTKAGHGAGKPTTMAIAEAADLLAFLVKVFGM
ncbi:MAG TPA: prolyl oligopeptidase family serine peptidase [Kofleriaceae bacterium]|nr:prolyl oligopeptidase family serine peptidase [Kofleriaceae bacterium]